MCAVAAEPIRVVYFGTPDYALPALRALAVADGIDLSLVVTQPDRPAGRGRTLTPPPVKAAAIELGIPVYQPLTLRTADDRQPIAAQQADLFVVAAFGKVFGPKLLALPRLGSINLHASLLPDYRGASPISAAILEGQLRTGVTLMQMDVGLDTGPIIAETSFDILPTYTTAALTPILAEAGCELLLNSLDDLVSGGFRPVAQDGSVASITRPMVKADGWIDWSRSAREIERQIRAMWDWPRAWTTFEGELLQIHEASVADGQDSLSPGVASHTPEGAAVATGDGCVILRTVQRAGSKPVPGDIWLRTVAAEGAILGTQNQPQLPETPLIRAVED